MEKVLSLIIPTYNMEKYLNKCLNSLIVDNMDLLEVLVINDGSKDRSSEIAHEYEKKYPKTFRVIDKENGNYGSCINRGLKEATGKYVKVLDADDYFNTEVFSSFIELLLSINVDLVLTDFATVDGYGKSIHIFNYKTMGIEDDTYSSIKKLMEISPTFYGQMHGFTYRLEMLREMRYQQTEGISYTDQEWVDIPFTHVKSFYYSPMNLYRYFVEREGNTMQSIRGKSISQLMTVVLRISEFFEKEEYNKSLFESYLEHQLYLQLELIYETGIYKKSYDMELLCQFDERLKNLTKTYKVAEMINYKSFRYVREWRTHNMKITPLIKVVFAVRNTMKFLKKHH